MRTTPQVSCHHHYGSCFTLQNLFLRHYFTVTVHNELLEIFTAGMYAEIRQCVDTTRLRPNLNKGQSTHLTDVFFFSPRRLTFPDHNFQLQIVTANTLKDVLATKSNHVMTLFYSRLVKLAKYVNKEMRLWAWSHDFPNTKLQSLSCFRINYTGYLHWNKKINENATIRLWCVFKSFWKLRQFYQMEAQRNLRL